MQPFFATAPPRRRPSLLLTSHQKVRPRRRCLAARAICNPVALHSHESPPRPSSVSALTYPLVGFAFFGWCIMLAGVAYMQARNLQWRNCTSSRQPLSLPWRACARARSCRSPPCPHSALCGPWAAAAISGGGFVWRSEAWPPDYPPPCQRTLAPPLRPRAPPPALWAARRAVWPRRAAFSRRGCPASVELLQPPPAPICPAAPRQPSRPPALPRPQPSAVRLWRHSALRPPSTVFFSTCL